MTNGNNDKDMVTASERHHQIMMELMAYEKAFKWGCGIIVVIAGAIAFFYFKNTIDWKEFLRYP